MSAGNETLLEIVNSIANDITGADAQTSGVNPIKSKIIEVINDTQKDIVNSKDWTFMTDTQDIDGFTVSTTTATNVTGFYADFSASFKTSYLPNITEYFTEKFTSDADYLSKPLTLTTSIKQSFDGSGAPSGTLSAYICPDSNGAPDLANPLITADAHTLTINDIFWTTQTFYFTANTDVLLKGTTYWVVFKWVGAADNGDGFYIAYDHVTTSSSAVTYTRLNNATTWTAFTAGHLVSTLTYYETEYETNLTLPTDVKKVYRMFSGDADDPTNNLLPFSTAQYMQSPEDVPEGYFVVRSATDGALEVWINPATANQTSWTLEYKKNVTALSADADYPVIPRDYRALLKYGPILYFISMGLGMQDTGSIALIQAKYDKMLKDMRVDFLPNNPVRMGAATRSNRLTSSPFGNYSPNMWSVK